MERSTTTRRWPARWPGLPPAGRLAFVAGPLEGGWQVLQVWRREELDTFDAEHLLPAPAALGDAGFPAPPVVRDFLAEQAHLTP